jgi:hypothetical protein
MPLEAPVMKMVWSVKSICDNCRRARGAISSLSSTVAPWTLR